MTEKELIEELKQAYCEIKKGLEISFLISNDVETMEFLTGEKELNKACKEIAEIADGYDVEGVVEEELKNCGLPVEYIKVDLLKEQTGMIKERLNKAREIVERYLGEAA